MTLRIAQSSRYRGRDRWEWSVWLEGAAPELDAVESVAWLLHPTFPNPVQERTNRQDKFRLDTTGWGEFEIRAEIRRRNGRTLKRSHKLVLEDDGEAAAEPQQAKTQQAKNMTRVREDEPPQVFLASSVVDQPIAAILRETLKGEGLRLATDAIVEGGMPITLSIERALQSSNAVVAIFSDRTSPWVVDEVRFARSLGIPILPVVVGTRTKLPESIGHVAAIYLGDPDDAAKMAPQVAERIRAFVS